MRLDETVVAWDLQPKRPDRQHLILDRIHVSASGRY